MDSSLLLKRLWGDNFFDWKKMNGVQRTQVLNPVFEVLSTLLFTSC